MNWTLARDLEDSLSHAACGVLTRVSLSFPSKLAHGGWRCACVWCVQALATRNAKQNAFFFLFPCHLTLTLPLWWQRCLLDCAGTLGPPLTSAKLTPRLFETCPPCSHRLTRQHTNTQQVGDKGICSFIHFKRKKNSLISVDSPRSLNFMVCHLIFIYQMSRKLRQ